MVDGRDPGRVFFGREPKSTVKPRWLEHPTPPCCALDVIEFGRDREPLHRLAWGLGVTEDGLRRILNRAMAKMQIGLGVKK